VLQLLDFTLNKNMNYTYAPINDSSLFELRVNEIIFILDSEDDAYSKMIADFIDDKKIKHFVALLLDDPAAAFEIYNNG
jgi:hypothetical protein